MFMKTILSIIVLLMVGLSTMEAQNRLLVVKKTDGTTQEIPVKDIVEMTVEEYLPLKVSVSENEKTDPAASSKAKSKPAKAPIITTSTLTSFKMFTDIHKGDLPYTLTKTSSGWKEKDDYDRWPTANTEHSKKVTFYAYNGGDLVFDTNSTYIQFNVDHSPWDQIDLLVACQYQTSFDDCDGCVNLTFDHVCSAVDFKISMTNKLKQKLGDNKLSVTKVSLKNVLDVGRYEYDLYSSTGSWNSDHLSISGYEYTLTNTNIEITETPEYLPCGYLFMIPQILDTYSRAELVINYVVGNGGSTKTASIPLNNGYVWKAGHKHTMSIILNTSMIEL